MHHVDNAVMPTHDWRGLTIRDLTPPEAGWQASFIEIDVPAGAVHPLRARPSARPSTTATAGNWNSRLATSNSTSSQVIWSRSRPMSGTATRRPPARRSC